MELNRRLGLALVVVVVGALTWSVISAVFGTVFFALTVASVVLPLQKRLEARGIPEYWAAVVTTGATFVGGVVVFSPLFVVAYLRREQMFGLVQTLPETFSVTALGTTYELSLEEAQSMALDLMTVLLEDAARAAPDLSLKVLVFVMVLFGFLIGQDHAYRTVLGVVPVEYRDAMRALHERTKDTLQAIYLLQIATAVGTFAMALPTFWLLGYDFPVTMAVIAGVLQFLPVIGPSLLIGAAALYHMSVGDVNAAILIVVVGGVVIAYLPDALIRPRLAAMTADMPGSLYFVGFVGGLLTVGPVGVIMGPLAVALFTESVTLLSDEVPEVPVPDEGDDEVPDDGAEGGLTDAGGPPPDAEGTDTDGGTDVPEPEVDADPDGDDG
ncbi:AI-2E family transporter [Haloarchaeobius iranensis]|uniref:Predicted PurR-regulated permease PerM n=1 Tax=Haloarchaeobius iranensis TaxID=996166 RepID=A0A1G9VDT8_9EURY|nr:AI-2E family transporter [Haloarchaeobius iranensis]SDM70251.1 Predicted PurR-regulated permease PerM [Haloarchaeobius iranensis]